MIRTYLGIEGGGTRTTALVADENLRLVALQTFGPCNARLLNDAILEQRLREIARFCPAPNALALGVAGVRSLEDRKRFHQCAARIWPGIPCHVTHDLEIALLAGAPSQNSARVLVLSGTGSCCYARAPRGAEAKLGGWGHFLGDTGSGYHLAHSALRDLIHEHDRHHRWTALGRRILQSLLLNHPEELIPWSQAANKAEISALAVHVFGAAAEGDPIARRILRHASESLAKDALLCAGRIAQRGTPVTFVLAGGVLVKQPAFARTVARRIKSGWPGSEIQTLRKEGAWGAIQLAAALPGKSAPAPNQPEPGAPFYLPTFVPNASPTEQRNPKSTHLDRLSISEAISLMIDDETGLAAALRKEARSIHRAVRLCSETLRAGGRIFYVGAGTSGRLGVLDASECPPTFRASPDMVQGIMAGGHRALWQAVEGAEDDAQSGADAVRFRDVRRGDVLIGIAASGRTPFVWGALAAARQAGSSTVLLHFNPSLLISPRERPTVIIAPNLGPEILTGSTRLKCGTATKLILNMISTISMVRLGKVASNLMIDLNPSNVKLRDRAVRIIQELTACDSQTARRALEANEWVVKKAWIALQRRKKPARKVRKK